ncbi:MAG TPA: Zn-ribbon domain-containing OB-fold protein [Candidatus Limnocylindria bacterium]|nr:Zn-ribbon domain-containing OB-fold protein [Candidatus Limnocylindria bacterium]
MSNTPCEPPATPVELIEAKVELPYHYVAGDYRAQYLRALQNKRILGSRCPVTGKVFVPPIVNSPASMARCGELVDVADRGTITTFCVVNIDVIGRNLKLPYVAASVALDGADISIFALVYECEASEVRMGMRVAAVWKPDGERQGSHEDILYFRPTGEPDAPRESYIDRL